jgi:hypothetical protein
LLKSSEQDLLRVYLPERDWRVTLGGAAMMKVAQLYCQLMMNFDYWIKRNTPQ